MNLDDVANEVRTALDTIAGLHVPEWGVQRLSSLPAGLVTLPEQITYDATYGRGADQITGMGVIILVPHPSKPEARRSIAVYADGSGPKSVKAAVEAYAYTSCDSLRVASAEFDVASYAGTEYLAAMFHLDITGQGG